MLSRVLAVAGQSPMAPRGDLAHEILEITALARKVAEELLKNFSCPLALAS